MSRVGKYPVGIPDGVDVSLAGNILTAKGKLGELTVPFTDDVTVEMKDGKVVVTPNGGGKRARAMWGTVRSLVSNAVVGVSEGFTRRLEINGVGYRAQVQGKKLNLQLGYSHDIPFEIPEGITIKMEGDRQSVIAVSGADRQQVGQVASVIRGYRGPEPYKGKGIKYEDEYILRKEGKKK
jgi:large subunit ribosomal protein L6